MASDHHESPSDWAPVRDLSRVILGEVPRISAAVTAFIRETVPVYAGVPEDEHRRAVEQQLRIRVAALSQRRPLTSSELVATSRLAELRASEGIPVDALIAAHQAGDQEIWRLVIHHGTSDIDSLLPEVGQLMFAATSSATEVIARTHSRVARDIDGGRITMAYQFFGALAVQSRHAEATLMAGNLGFDPRGDFVGIQWVAHETAHLPHEAVSALRSARLDIAWQVTAQRRLDVLVQGDDIDDGVTRVVDRLIGGRVGIGLRREGLTGAVTSLADARIALETTTADTAVSRFADSWNDALVLAESARIHPVTRLLVETARQQPHLAETVRTFAVADMSIARAAQSLHLHANSVTYRLGRWAALTGHDPRTFDGLRASVVACLLAEHQAL